MTELPQKRAKIAREQQPRFRGWCFTWNNPTEFDYSLVPNVQYIVVGEEVGESGTLHHQGYVYFKNERQFGGVQKVLPPGCHIESQRGTPAEASDYCKKDGKIIYESGTLPIKGRRNDVEEIRQVIKGGGSMVDVMEIASSYQAAKFGQLYLSVMERKREFVPVVYWFHGKTGTGKTRAAFELSGGEGNPDTWVSESTLQWWGGYTGQRHVIIDDFRGHFCPFSSLLRFLDRYPVRVPFKGGSCPLLATTIIVTSPHAPEDVYQKEAEDMAQLTRRIHVVREFK